MKQVGLILIFFLPILTHASDLTLGPIITSPKSGCTLSNTETAKVTIINAAISPYSGTFNISCKINGTTVTESVTVPLLPTSTTYIYEFSQDMDLSSCGIHDITFFVTDAADVNRNNDTLRVSITNDCPPVKGSIVGPSAVCQNNNTGTIDLVGNTGIIDDWEISIDGGNNWTSLNTSLSSVNYDNISTASKYKVIFNSLYGYCPSDSINHDITIDSPSFGGVLPSDSIHCDTILPTVLHLEGYNGQIINWQFSLDAINFSDVINPYDTLEYYELGQNFYLFAITKNGTCPQDSSNIINLSVIPGSAAGIISGIDSLCFGETSTELTLNNNNGTISSWLASFDDGQNWTNISSTSNPITINNITTKTLISAIVKEGKCPSDSSFFTITTIPTSDAGNLIGATLYCDTINTGLIHISNQTGSIVDWLISSDNGQNYVSLNYFKDSLTYNDISISTRYKVIVKHLQCPTDTTSSVNIDIYSSSFAGVINAIDSSCITDQNIWLTLEDQIGEILSWEYSTNNGNTWKSKFTSNDSLQQYGLNESIDYRVIAKANGCESDTSYHTIKILPEQLSITQTDTLYYGESIQINSPNGLEYLWSPNENISSPIIQSPILSPTIDKNYEVIIVNTSGCIDTSFFEIIVVDNPFGVTASTLVTANGDGRNEIWYIKNIEKYISNSVTVFDGYGRILLQESPYHNDWDLFQNQIPNGTYYYLIILNEQFDPIKGTFTVIGASK